MSIGEYSDIHNWCCGCGACATACRIKAIEFITDKEGFQYPRVGENCIECNACVHVCPGKQHQEEGNFFHERGEAYAGWALDSKIRTTSSSGGVFRVIAEKILEHDGVVFGAAFSPFPLVRHIPVYAKEDLFQLQGSKYVQSNTEEVFHAVHGLLQVGKKVLFCGTPCQVAGLRNSIRSGHENLMTVDLICHGVPSPVFFQDYVAYRSSKLKKKVTDFRFRFTERWGYGEQVFADNSVYKVSETELSPYMYAFMNGLNYRPSCYNCRFACVRRCGDITLGDFWGAARFFQRRQYAKGVSAILVNTVVGHELFQEISDEIYTLKVKVEDVAKENHNLNAPCEKPQQRDSFYREVHFEGMAAFCAKLRPRNYSRLRLRQFARVFLEKTGMLRLLNWVRER